MKTEIEIWRPVPSKGIAASSWGRVCKFPTKSKMPHGGHRWYLPKPIYGTITRSRKTAKHSYLGIYYRGIGNVKIHRAICEAFHGPSPFEKAVVIHIDENAHNNVPSNLKWGTQKENLNGRKFLEYCASRTGENSPGVKGRKKSLK